ncbi:MAG: tetratricopeptide repeat protein [Chloroherpetonaceae bacterium]|nr:tetratricopeptide repeat protein [Chloroherpetonaceae bacterium]
MQSAPDSINQLESRLSEIRDPKERVNLLNKIAWEKRFIDTHAAMEYAGIANQLSIQIGYEIGLAYSLRNEGICSYLLSNYEDGLLKTLEALELFERFNDQNGEASTFNIVGTIYEGLGIYASALDSYLKSAKHFQSLNDLQGQATVLNNIGNIYQKQGDYDKALEYHLSSLKIKESSGDLQGQAKSLNNIGLVYEKMGDVVNAIDYHIKCMKLTDSIGDTQGYATAFLNIGSFYHTLGNYEKALDYHFISLTIFDEMGDKNSLAITYNNIGRIYHSLGHYAKALENILEALNIATQINAKEILCDVYQALAAAYEIEGDFVNALDAQRKFTMFKEEMFNEETRRKMRSLQVNFEVIRMEREKEIYYLRNTELKRANVALEKSLKEAEQLRRDAEKRKEEAEQANKLKSELLGIAAHDLKNPLQTIMGFSRLIEEEADKPAQVVEMSNYIYNSSTRMFNIISNLLKMSAVESGTLNLNLQVLDFNQIVAAAAKNNFILAEAKNQKLQISLSRETYVIADEERLMDIFDNLISNAIKYSPIGKPVFISTEKMIIDSSETPSLEAITDAKSLEAFSSPKPQVFVRLSVRDQGQGLTEKDKTKLFGKFQRLSAKPTAGESSTGLGLSIVKQYVDLFGGKVWAESEGKDKGSAFIVEFPCVPPEEVVMVRE